jgi:hypothetical protein
VRQSRPQPRCKLAQLGRARRALAVSKLKSDQMPGRVLIEPTGGVGPGTRPCASTARVIGRTAGAE